MSVLKKVARHLKKQATDKPKRKKVPLGPQKGELLYARVRGNTIHVV